MESVYASDEGRMLAEMGDPSFRLGSILEDDYEQIFTSSNLLTPLEESFALQRAHVQRLRLRALLWLRSRVSLCRFQGLRRSKTRVGILFSQYGDMPASDTNNGRRRIC